MIKDRLNAFVDSAGELCVDIDNGVQTELPRVVGLCIVSLRLSRGRILMFRCSEALFS